MFFVLLLSAYAFPMIGGKFAKTSKEFDAAAQASPPRFVHLFFNLSACALIGTFILEKANLAVAHFGLFEAYLAFVTTCAARDYFLIRFCLRDKPN